MVSCNATMELGKADVAGQGGCGVNVSGEAAVGLVDMTWQGWSQRRFDFVLAWHKVVAGRNSEPHRCTVV